MSVRRRRYPRVVSTLPPLSTTPPVTTQVPQQVLRQVPPWQRPAVVSLLPIGIQLDTPVLSSDTSPGTPPGLSVGRNSLLSPTNSETLESPAGTNWENMAFGFCRFALHRSLTTDETASDSDSLEASIPLTRGGVGRAGEIRNACLQKEEFTAVYL